MSHPRFLKDLPVPLRKVIRPMLFVSLGLHGLLLAIPIPPEPQPDPLAETEPIDVVQLPPSPSPQPSPTVPPSPPTPVPSPSPQTPAPVEPSPRKLPSPPPQVVQPPPSPVSPSPVVSPTPTPSPSATPTPTPSPSPTVEASPPEAPYADFPHTETAQPCNGSESCWQIADIRWRSFNQDIKQNLKNQGYQLEKLDLADDIGKQGYKVVKDGETHYYLYLFSKNPGVEYRLLQQELTPEELAQMVAR